MNKELMTQRIAENLEHLKQFTATPNKGCTRLPFTKEARDAANYIKDIMQKAGLEVKEDEAGNVFGFIYGSDTSLPCVMMGSHYDSVVNGGDYDGIAGVICAIEVARQLNEKNTTPKRTFVAAAFCDEEGMRFGTGYFGSGAMLVGRTPEYCKTFTDKNDVSIYDAMLEYGLDPEKIGNAKWEDNSIGYFIEAHIEQGPVLHAENIQIGLVDCIVGIDRYMVTVHGRSDHAGTTPMNMRLDAVDAATKVISKIADWARETDDGSVATVGYIKTIPGGMNIVAEACEFTVDIRSRNIENLEKISAKLHDALEHEVKAMGGSFDIQNKLAITPVNLHQPMLSMMEESCKNHNFSYRYMHSGAGHDALEIGQVVPTAMLFVPSVDGRSHCMVEHTDYSHFGNAALIMTELAEKLTAN